MKTSVRNLLSAVTLFAGLTATAGDNTTRLYIIGEATTYGWSLDMAQALVPSDSAPSEFAGTLYLKAGEGSTFKFMESHEWGGVEYGLPADVASSVVNGSFRLASGSLDEGYRQMSVATDGNYRITVNTTTLEADITLAEYQESEIRYCSLFMVGSATTGGWAVEEATPLCQVADTPYEYRSTAALKATDNGAPASFKIITAMRGAGSWDASYFLFRDADDPSRITSDSTDDRQWSVGSDGKYDVTVNTIANTISITPASGNPAGIDSAEISGSAASPVYYDMQGRKVSLPAKGIFIEVSGSSVRKVVIR